MRIQVFIPCARRKTLHPGYDQKQETASHWDIYIHEDLYMDFGNPVMSLVLITFMNLYPGIHDNVPIMVFHF